MEDLHEKLFLLKLDFLKKLFPDATFSVSEGGIIDSDLVTLFSCDLRKIVDSNLEICISARVSTSTFCFC